MGKVVTLCLVAVGIINFIPLAGVVSVQNLESAYSITLAGNDLAILMRHRALLFGILGAFIIFSAFNPAFQLVAMIMAAVSMLGFAFLVVSAGGYNDALGRVLVVDVVGIAFLLTAGVVKYLPTSD